MNGYVLRCRSRKGTAFFLLVLLTGKQFALWGIGVKKSFSMVETCEIKLI